MEPGLDMLDALAAQLPQTPGPWLGIGDRRTLQQLQQRVPSLTCVLLEASRAQRDSGHAITRALQADPRTLPLAEASLEGLIAVSALSRYPDAAELLAVWTRHLQPGALLLIAEPLVRSATMRGLRRWLGGPRFARAPEEITGLLLNAGFGAIGQRLAGARGSSLISWGRLREL